MSDMQVGVGPCESGNNPTIECEKKFRTMLVPKRDCAGLVDASSTVLICLLHAVDGGLSSYKTIGEGITECQPNNFSRAATSQRRSPR
jgi:hypothetical protein